MPTTLAIAGKGGVGKTLISSLLIRYLLDRQLGPILAVDADPSTNLHMALGTSIDGTVGDIREDMLTLSQSGKFPAGMSKNEYLDYHLKMMLTESDGFDLLAMGRPEGPGCYCAVNNLLRLLIDHLAQNYSFVVVDNEAGMEHLSHRTTRDVDLLLLVTDPTVRGVISAAEMQQLAGKLQIHVGRTQVIVNRVMGRGPEVDQEDLPLAVRETVAARGMNLAGLVPRDDTVAEFDAEGKPLFKLPSDSPAQRAVTKIFRSLPELNGHELRAS